MHPGWQRRGGQTRGGLNAPVGDDHGSTEVSSVDLALDRARRPIEEGDRARWRARSIRRDRSYEGHQLTECRWVGGGRQRGGGAECVTVVHRLGQRARAIEEIAISPVNGGDRVVAGRQGRG